MSSLLKELHEMAQEIHQVGLMSEQTMREFDVLCCPPVKEYTPEEIQKLRKRCKVSQAVFAASLNTGPSTVQKWEQGQKKPSKLALKLLSLVDKYGLELMWE